MFSTKKQYSLLLLEITHAKCLKHTRKNLPDSLREQFCNPTPTPPVGRKPVYVWGGGHFFRGTGRGGRAQKVLGRGT